MILTEYIEDGKRVTNLERSDKWSSNRDWETENSQK